MEPAHVNGVDTGCIGGTDAGMIPHMPNLLSERIQTRLDALGLSARKASLRAELHPDFIRNIQRGKSLNPGAANLSALARVLEVPVDYLLSAVQDQIMVAPPPSPSYLHLVRIPVRGYVQAGKWREAIEWDRSSWYNITVPRDDRYPDMEQFALEVRGNSMNRLYPEGTILVCVRYFDLVRPPKPGERVICLRRDRFGEFEATVKEYQVDGQGRHVLWPRSDDPDHQQPIILPGPEVPVSTDTNALPSRANAGPFADDGGVADIVISALVIQSVRRE